MSARNRIRVDIAIVGGGIAGLWLLNLLRARGYTAVLIERTAFGDGQTIRSQGMIHGGLKYALSGSVTTASEAIATMPDRWRDCLRGSGDVDLRGVRTSAERCHLWRQRRLGAGDLRLELVGQVPTAIAGALPPWPCKYLRASFQA